MIKKLIVVILVLLMLTMLIACSSSGSSNSNNSSGHTNKKCYACGGKATRKWRDGRWYCNRCYAYCETIYEKRNLCLQEIE